MPGISVVCDKHLDKNLISDSLIDLKYAQNYKAQKIFENSSFVVAFSGYEGYPRQYFEDDNTVIVVDGLIYNRSDSETEELLKAISKSYIENNDYTRLVGEFVDNSDGDFDTLIYFKQLDEFIIFNDRWGRLPSYYFCADDTFVFSRELKIILNFIRFIEFDKVSMAEFLVFGHTLGNRTLIKNIYRVSPSCLFNSKSSDNTLTVEIKRVFDVNFEECPITPPKNECVEKCRDLFLQSVNRRINKSQEKKYNITADLSGGYDTRTVLAGLSKFNAKVDCYTDCLITGDESEYAYKVSALYGKKLIRSLASHDINYSDMSKITYMTDCTVNGLTALSCYQDSLERIKQIKDVSIRVMGFGGEFIRHPFKEVKGYKTITDMLEDGYFINYIKIKDACLIVNLARETFHNHLTAYFDGYPEPTLRDKIKHLYFEYYNNMVNAGENRARLHFWTVQPLWSKDLFNFEMKYIPTKYINFNFFREFMRLVDADLLGVPIYPGNVRLDSKMRLFQVMLISKLKEILFSSRYLGRFALRVYECINRIKTASDYQGIKEDLIENYSNLEVLSSYLNEKGIHKFMETEHRYNNLYQLMTVMLYFKEIETRYGYKCGVDRQR